MLCWQRHDMVFILGNVFESYWLKPRLNVFFFLYFVICAFIFVKEEPTENFWQNRFLRKGGLK